MLRFSLIYFPLFFTAFTSGLESGRFLKIYFVIIGHLQSSRATASAERGLPAINPIFPKISYSLKTANTFFCRFPFLGSPELYL